MAFRFVSKKGAGMPCRKRTPNGAQEQYRDFCVIADWKSRVLRSFDSCAGSYALYSGAQERVAWTLSSFLPGLNAPDVLEVGCGTGLLTRYLAEKYPDGRFLVTDIAPHMLRAVSKAMAGSGRRIQWREMDGENPNLDQKFDLIAANMAVIKQLFSKCKKTLRTKTERVTQKA